MKAAALPLCLSLLIALSAPCLAAPTKAAKKAVSPPTVAVLYFDYSGKDAEMAMLKKGLAQMVISDLSGVEQVRIVERDRLQEIIAELKLQRTARFDKKTAARIGKLLGARFMVLGGYFAMMGTLRIDARVVAVETGEIVKSVGVNGKQADFIGLEQKLSAGLAKILSGPLPPAPKRSAKARKTRKTRKVRKATTRRRRPAKPPKKLDTKTAIEYAKALHAKDEGDFKKAKAALRKVVTAKPDFQLAQLDLASMVQ